MKLNDVQSGGIGNVCLQIKEISAIFTYLKLWIALARHNIKCVKIKLYLACTGLSRCDTEAHGAFVALQVT